MVTDPSKVPRETYYACPHCRLRLELMLNHDEDNGSSQVQVKVAESESLLPPLAAIDANMVLDQASSNPGVKSPNRCGHFLGYLRGLPEDVDISDECAVCPNVVHCFLRKDSSRP